MTAPRWLEHFDLDEAPFSKAIADGDLWVPASRQPVIDELVEACEERSHILLTGEPGVGKTCVLRALRRQLPDAGFRLTYWVSGRTRVLLSRLRNSTLSMWKWSNRSRTSRSSRCHSS